MSKLATLSTVAAIAALSCSISANAAPGGEVKNWEKCAGVAKMGKNDCGALDGSHGCAGQAKEDNLAHEWLYLPEGTCDKLAGGTLVDKNAKTM